MSHFMPLGEEQQSAFGIRPTEGDSNRHQSVVFCNVAFTTCQMRRLRTIADVFELNEGQDPGRDDAAPSEGVIILHSAIEKVIETSCNIMKQFSESLWRGGRFGIVNPSIGRALWLAARRVFKRKDYAERDFAYFISPFDVEDLWPYSLQSKDDTFDFPLSVASREQMKSNRKKLDGIKNDLGMDTDQEFFLTSLGMLNFIVDKLLDNDVIVERIPASGRRDPPACTRFRKMNFGPT